MEFHEHLKQLRTNSGYTQEQLARQLHVSRQTISSWEQGRTEPDITALQQLCECFSTSLDTLLLERMEGYAVPYTFHRRLLLAHIPAALLLSAALLYQKIAIGGWLVSFSYLLLHLMLYVILTYCLKHHDYSFLAGYDETFAYREDTIQRMLSYMLGNIGITSLLYTLLQLILVMSMQGALTPYIFICYIVQFCGAIVYANRKYQSELLQDRSLYIYLRSLNKLTMAMLGTIALIVCSVLTCFTVFDIKNNSPQAAYLLFILLPYLFLNTIWGVVQSLQSKKLLEKRQLFAFHWKSYLLFAVDILLCLLLFFICWWLR